MFVHKSRVKISTTESCPIFYIPISLTLYNHTALINSALKDNNNITIRSEKKTRTSWVYSYKLLNFYPRYKIFFFREKVKIVREDRFLGNSAVKNVKFFREVIFSWVSETQKPGFLSIPELELWLRAQLNKIGST